MKKGKIEIKDIVFSYATDKGGQMIVKAEVSINAKQRIAAEFADNPQAVEMAREELRRQIMAMIYGDVWELARQIALPLRATIDSNHPAFTFIEMLNTIGRK